jgi:CRP-like cAMP-binding protein
MDNYLNNSELLHNIPISSRLTDEESKILAGKLRVKNFERDKTIFRQGDIGDELFIIIRGLVHIFTTSETGQEHSVTVFGDGDFFGELALVDGRPRSATAEAIRLTTALTLRREDFEDLLNDHPAIIASILLTDLASRVRRDNVQAEILSHSSAPQRVALLLIELARQRGVVSEGATRIELYLNQDKLASMLGMTREAFNRALTKMRKKDLLYIEQQTVVIRSLEQLEQSLELLRTK